MKCSVTQEKLKRLLIYDSKTGIFTWRVRRGGKARAGDVAGSVRSDGYRAVKINSRNYQEHRLAWLYIHGTFPSNQIDHINRIRVDNRISNLRLATNMENSWNTSAAGVGFHKITGKYQAYIYVRGKHIHLGLFDTVEEAATIRRGAEQKYFGEFARRECD